MHNGAPTLFINGVPNAGMTYMTYNPAKKHYESFGKAGVDLASLSVTADFSLHFEQPTAWLGPGQYDFSDMDNKMQLILEANPDAYVFPRVYMCSPPWWDEQHPDQLVKWDDGTIERTIGRKKRFPSWARGVSASFSAEPAAFYRAREKAVVCKSRDWLSHRLGDVGRVVLLEFYRVKRWSE